MLSSGELKSVMFVFQGVERGADHRGKNKLGSKVSSAVDYLSGQPCEEGGREPLVTAPD